VSFAYEGNRHEASVFVDRSGAEWKLCSQSGVFKNAEGGNLGDFPVMSISANDAGSFVFGGSSETLIFHRDGSVESTFIPLIRDLLNSVSAAAL